MDNREVFVIEDRVYGRVVTFYAHGARVEWLSDGFLFNMDLAEDEYILLDEDNINERF